MKRGSLASGAAIILAACTSMASDDYDWLSEAGDPKVQQWVEARNAEYTREVASLPAVDQLAERIEELTENAIQASELYRLGSAGRSFSLSTGPEYAGSVILEQPSGRLVFDPGELELDGRWTIDWFVPSPDGRLVAVSASPDGTERGTLFVVEATTGRLAQETIYNVNNATAGGDLAWSEDSSGFFYTRYPQTTDEAEGASGQRIYYHALGTARSEDRLEFVPPSGHLAEIRIVSSQEGERFAAWVQDGDSGRFSLHLRRSSGQWEQVAGFDQGLVQPFFGPGGELFAISRARHAIGEILRLPWTASTIDDAEPFVGPLEGAALAASFYSHGTPTAAWSGDRLYVMYQMGGPMGLASYDIKGERLNLQTFGRPSSIRSWFRTGEKVRVRVEDYLTPADWIDLDADLDEVVAPRSASADEIVVIRGSASSKDGIRIPFSILRQRGVVYPAPVLVYGYGGFGISRTPSYDPELRALLERGVMFVDTNIRGGSEFGDSWRQQATREGRQKAYDDFQAILAHLHQEGVSKPEWTAIEGSSNGGLLMGVTLTQAPHLARTVLAHVGLYDMTRYEFGVNGAFNVAEYGDLDDRRERAALLSYSPLQHVRLAVDYPAVLMTVGANDPRVDPAHSRRMLEALRQADGDEDPFLLRTDFGAGHYGGGREERVRHRAEEFAFLLSRFRAAGWKGSER